MTEYENDEYNMYSLSDVNIEQLIHGALHHNDSECLCALGYCYENGIQVEKDEIKAYEYYKAAADLGLANGIYNVAIFTGWGKGGVTRSPEKYFELIKKSAEMGFAPAQNDLGWCYEEGINHGCVDFVDRNLAFKWYLKSALQDHSTGITNLIRCYREGIGTEINEEEAQKWERRVK